MITIIDYDAGNLTSVKRALNAIDAPAQISSDPETILSAERIIFPGVGHATSAMESLKRKNLLEPLREAFKKGTPIMGICLGTQIILERSDEGDTSTIGLIPGECIKFNLMDRSLAIPHMGWNAVKKTKNHHILKDLKEGDELYFVHSYYPLPKNSETIYATCEYEIEFPCALGLNNLFATQFHPEKSGPVGLQMLKNFSTWDGSDA